MKTIAKISKMNINLYPYFLSQILEKDMIFIGYNSFGAESDNLLTRNLSIFSGIFMFEKYNIEYISHDIKDQKTELYENSDKKIILNIHYIVKDIENDYIVIKEDNLKKYLGVDKKAIIIECYSRLQTDYTFFTDLYLLSIEYITSLGENRYS